MNHVHVCEAFLLIVTGPLELFSHSIEPYLRSLGLPTSLEKGKVTMLQEFRVCEAGDTVTPEQAKILVSVHVQ